MEKFFFSYCFIEDFRFGKYFYIMKVVIGQEFCLVVNIIKADFSSPLICLDSVSISVAFKGYIEKHFGLYWQLLDDHADFAVFRMKRNFAFDLLPKLHSIRHGAFLLLRCATCKRRDDPNFQLYSAFQMNFFGIFNFTANQCFHRRASEF